jgi:hypothetical protein
MKTQLVVPIVLAMTVGAVIGVYYYNMNKPSVQNAAPTCSDAPAIESHVYHPDRLVVYKDCQTVSGTVAKIRVEPDGDYHIRLALDYQYRNLTNDVNDQQQYGDLVLEIICGNPVSQQDAIDACKNYTNQITVPQEGQHIVAVGAYVLDTDHGWTEIHPVVSLTIEST